MTRSAAARARRTEQDQRLMELRPIMRARGWRWNPALGMWVPLRGWGIKRP